MLIKSINSWSVHFFCLILHATQTPSHADNNFNTQKNDRKYSCLTTRSNVSPEIPLIIFHSSFFSIKQPVFSSNILYQLLSSFQNYSKSFEIVSLLFKSVMLFRNIDKTLIKKKKHGYENVYCIKQQFARNKDRIKFLINIFWIFKNYFLRTEKSQVKSNFKFKIYALKLR